MYFYDSGMFTLAYESTNTPKVTFPNSWCPFPGTRSQSNSKGSMVGSASQFNRFRPTSLPCTQECFPMLFLFCSKVKQNIHQQSTHDLLFVQRS